MSVVVSCRVPDEIAARLDAQLERAELKNRSQAVGTAILFWLRQKEGQPSLEDRLADRLAEVVRAELAALPRASGDGGAPASSKQDPLADKKARFLAAGRR